MMPDLPNVGLERDIEQFIVRMKPDSHMSEFVGDILRSIVGDQ